MCTCTCCCIPGDICSSCLPLHNSPLALPAQIWHGRVTVYDPGTLSLELGIVPHHASPNDVIFGTQPQFVLQKATLGIQHARDNSDSSYKLELVSPHEAEWGGLVDGEPWVLQAQTPLSEHLEFYFCVNDWTYSALITEEVMELPPYLEPHTVCVYLFAAALCTVSH